VPGIVKTALGDPALSAETMSKEQVTPLQRRLYLLYHELRPTPSRYSYLTAPAVFQKHINLFAQLRTTENRLWPEVTFDDGHSSNFEYALPILQSQNMKARFFITVGWTGHRRGYMGWTELRSLQEAGHTIGAHGWTHTLLTHCTERDLQVELGNARATLEDKLGTSVTTMSLPGGRSNRRVLSACKEAGYTQIYTSEPRAESLPLGAIVGRLNIRGDMQPEWISNLFQPDSAVLASLAREYRMKATAKKLLGDGLYEKLWALLNRKEPDKDDGGDNAE
jgi:peptidoglycan/xylan/chitin deacetylase (PgdA/CDA1 family)